MYTYKIVVELDRFTEFIEKTYAEAVLNNEDMPEFHSEFYLSHSTPGELTLECVGSLHLYFKNTYTDGNVHKMLEETLSDSVEGDRLIVTKETTGCFSAEIKDGKFIVIRDSRTTQCEELLDWLDAWTDFVDENAFMQMVRG